MRTDIPIRSETESESVVSLLDVAKIHFPSGLMDFCFEVETTGSR